MRLAHFMVNKGEICGNHGFSCGNMQKNADRMIPPLCLEPYAGIDLGGGRALSNRKGGCLPETPHKKGGVSGNRWGSVSFSPF